MQVKIVSVSRNTNSFCLRGMIMIGDDGTAWEAAANSLNVRSQGDIVSFANGQNPETGSARLGWEIPRQMHPSPPPEVVREVWPDYVPKGVETNVGIA